MKPVLTFPLDDKARRRHRRSKSLPKLIPGSGKISANGALKVELTAVTGEVFVYAFEPRQEWMAELVERRPAPSAKPRPVVSSSDRFKTAIDTAMDILADLDARRVALTQAKPNIAAD
jgi:hypothetical protein